MNASRVVSSGHHVDARASRVVSSGYDHGVTRVISDGHHVDSRASRIVSSGYDHSPTRVISGGHVDTYNSSAGNQVVYGGSTGYTTTGSSDGKVVLTIRSAHFFKDSDTWGK